MVNMYIHHDRNIISNLDKNFDIVQPGRLDGDNSNGKRNQGSWF